MDAIHFHLDLRTGAGCTKGLWVNFSLKSHRQTMDFKGKLTLKSLVQPAPGIHVEDGPESKSIREFSLVV